MALTECKECGKEVSTRADKCPNCGAPVKKKSVGCLGCLGNIILIVFVLALIGYFSGSSTESDREKARVEEQRETAEVEQRRAPEEALKRAQERAQKRAEEKSLKEKAAFLENIEDHYQQLTAHYKRKDFEQAAEVLNLFVLHDKLDYKDVELINRKSVIWNIEKELPAVPATDIARNLGLYSQLADLDPTNQKYKQKLKYYTAKDEEEKREALMFKQLGSYYAHGKQWVNVLVKTNITEQQLIEIAKRLHKENPETFFHIFDDDTKIKEYVGWDRNYPNSKYALPEKWALKHLRGDINKMLLRGGGVQWQLTDYYGSQIAALE